MQNVLLNCLLIIAVCESLIDSATSSGIEIFGCSADFLFIVYCCHSREALLRTEFLKPKDCSRYQ